jgi:hypothetical protein
MYIAEKIRKKKEASSSHLESSSQTFQAADIPKKKREKLDPFFLFVLLDIPSSFFSFLITQPMCVFGSALCALVLVA